MKRIFSLLLAVCLCATVFAYPSAASPTPPTDNSEDALHCQYRNSDGNVVASCWFCDCDKLAERALEILEATEK